MGARVRSRRRGRMFPIDARDDGVACRVCRAGAGARFGLVRCGGGTISRRARQRRVSFDEHEQMRTACCAVVNGFQWAGEIILTIQYQQQQED